MRFTTNVIFSIVILIFSLACKEISLESDSQIKSENLKKCSEYCTPERFKETCQDLKPLGYESQVCYDRSSCFGSCTNYVAKDVRMTDLVSAGAAKVIANQEVHAPPAELLGTPVIIRNRNAKGEMKCLVGSNSSNGWSWKFEDCGSGNEAFDPGNKNYTFYLIDRREVSLTVPILPAGQDSPFKSGTNEGILGRGRQLVFRMMLRNSAKEFMSMKSCRPDENYKTTGCIPTCTNIPNREQDFQKTVSIFSFQCLSVDGNQVSVKPCYEANFFMGVPSKFFWNDARKTENRFVNLIALKANASAAIDDELTTDERVAINTFESSSGECPDRAEFEVNKRARNSSNRTRGKFVNLNPNPEPTRLRGLLICDRRPDKQRFSVLGTDNNDRLVAGKDNLCIKPYPNLDVWTGLIKKPWNVKFKLNEYPDVSDSRNLYFYPCERGRFDGGVICNPEDAIGGTIKSFLDWDEESRIGNIIKLAELEGGQNTASFRPRSCLSTHVHGQTSPKINFLKECKDFETVIVGLGLLRNWGRYLQGTVRSYRFFDDKKGHDVIKFVNPIDKKGKYCMNIGGENPSQIWVECDKAKPFTFLENSMKFRMNKKDGSEKDYGIIPCLSTSGLFYNFQYDCVDGDDVPEVSLADKFMGIFGFLSMAISFVAMPLVGLAPSIAIGLIFSLPGYFLDGIECKQNNDTNSCIWGLGLGLAADIIGGSLDFHDLAFGGAKAASAGKAFTPDNFDTKIRNSTGLSNQIKRSSKFIYKSLLKSGSINHQKSRAKSATYVAASLAQALKVRKQVKPFLAEVIKKIHKYSDENSGIMGVSSRHPIYGLPINELELKAFGDELIENIDQNPHLSKEIRAQIVKGYNNSEFPKDFP